MTTSTYADNTGTDIEIATGTDIGAADHILISKTNRPPVHEAATLFPELGSAELRELAADIKANGLHEPVDLYQGKILDGRNRVAAFLRLGITAIPCHRVGDDDPSFDPFAHVASKNLHRRHLTTKDKRDVIAKLLETNPAQSNRRVAATVGADHKTAAEVRAEGEARGEIPHVETRTDTKGRSQPAQKKSKSKAAPAKVKQPISYDFNKLRQAWREVKSMAAADNKTRLRFAIDQLAHEARTALAADGIKLAPDQGLQ